MLTFEIMMIFPRNQFELKWWPNSCPAESQCFEKELKSHFSTMQLCKLMTHLLMRLSSPKNDKFKITKIKFQKAFYGDFQTLWSGPGYISEVVYIVHTHTVLHWLPINCALCFSLLKKQDWNLQSPNKTRPLSQKSDDFDKYRRIKLDKVLLNWKKFTKMYKWQNKKTYK